MILRWSSHCVVVPIGYARGFVCLISCALWRATEEKDYQNHRIPYYKRQVLLELSGVTEDLYPLPTETWSELSSFIYTFTSHSREIITLFSLYQVWNCASKYLFHRKGKVFSFLFASIKEIPFACEIFVANKLCMSVRGVWIIRIARIKNITVTCRDCIQQMAVTGHRLISSCCFSLIAIGTQRKLINYRLLLCQKLTARRVQAGSTVRERGCHVAQDVSSKYFGLSSNNASIYSVASRWVDFLSDSFQEFPW